MAILFAALSRTAAFADDSTLNADICSMREKITANPATLSTSLAEVENNIDTVSDLKTKGPLLVHCAAGLSLTNVPAAQPDVLRLANQGMAFPLEIEDHVKALTLIGDALTSLNAKALPQDDTKRQQVAEPYLKALKIILDKVKTLTVEPTPEVEVYTVGGDEKFLKKLEDLEEKRRERREEILRNNCLVENGIVMVNRLAGLYSTVGKDGQKLRTLAESTLIEKNYLTSLFDQLNASMPLKTPSATNQAFVPDKLIDEQLREDFTAVVNQELPLSEEAKKSISRHHVARVIDEQMSFLSFTPEELHSLRTGQPLYSGEAVKAEVSKLPAQDGYSLAEELTHSLPLPAILKYYKKIYDTGNMTVIPQAIFVRLALANAAKTE